VSNVIPMPKLEIRPGRTEDLETLSPMVASVWNEIYGRHLGAESADAGSDAHIAELIGDPGANGWVAVLGTRVVGYCSIAGNCIEQIWVSATMRRKGVGTALTQSATDAIRSRGFAFAQMGCEDFNTEAEAFLSAGSWKCIGAETRSMAGGRTYEARVFATALK